MPQELRNTDALRDAYFWHVDLSGSVFRACDANNVKIVGSDVTNLRVNGHNGRAGTVIVDDVDVTTFVDTELDRRFPELVQMRQIRTAADFRGMWKTVETLWREAVARAQLLPIESLNERVDEEWSFIETLRHLVFATDVWVGRMFAGHRMPVPRALTSQCLLSTRGRSGNKHRHRRQALAGGRTGSARRQTISDG